MTDHIIGMDISKDRLDGHRAADGAEIGFTNDARGLRRHAQAQQAIECKDGVVAKTRQNGSLVGGDVEREQAQQIAKFALRNSPPKQISVFLSHESTLAYSQNTSDVVDPSGKTKPRDPLKKQGDMI